MEGEKSGIVESRERTMVEGVFYLGDRPLGTFMTHRSEVQWLDINAPAEELRAKVLEHRQQRCFPVVDGTLDAIIGAAYVEDMLFDLVSGSPAGLRAIMKKALFAPETMPALKAFESFRRGKADFLFVMDEYGGFAGIVRVHSLMEEIVGELTAPAGKEEQAVQQEDGTWLVDGGLNIDDAAHLLSLPGLSAAPGDYHTLAGFVLSLAGELPRTGDSVIYQGYKFTVVDMDGNRIEKIAVKQNGGAKNSST
jgi:putative hemolysin